MAVERWPVMVAMLAGDLGSDRTGRLLQKVFGRDDDDDDAGKCRKPPAPPA